MIATIKNMESIHESRGVELILVFCYESILLQLVLTRNESRLPIISFIVSIISDPE